MLLMDEGTYRAIIILFILASLASGISACILIELYLKGYSFVKVIVKEKTEAETEEGNRDEYISGVKLGTQKGIESEREKWTNTATTPTKTIEIEGSKYMVIPMTSKSEYDNDGDTGIRPETKQDYRKFCEKIDPLHLSEDNKETKTVEQMEA